MYTLSHGARARVDRGATGWKNVLHKQFRPTQSLALVIFAVQISSEQNRIRLSRLGWWSDLLILLSNITGLYDKNAEVSLIVNDLNGFRRPGRVPRRKQNSQNTSGPGTTNTKCPHLPLGKEIADPRVRPLPALPFSKLIVSLIGVECYRPLVNETVYIL